MESDVALSPSSHPRSLYDANALSRVFRGRTFGWPLILTEPRRYIHDEHDMSAAAAPACAPG